MTTERIDPFKYIDAAHQYTAESLMPIANIQWTDFDYLVRSILDYIPEHRKEDYLERVTDPEF